MFEARVGPLVFKVTVRNYTFIDSFFRSNSFIPLARGSQPPAPIEWLSQKDTAWPSTSMSSLVPSTTVEKLS